MLLQTRTVALATIILVAGLISVGQADHRRSSGHSHNHGHSHNYGHSHGGYGLGGGGFRLYIGPGYGSNFGYGNGYYGGSRGYYSPSYSTPTYVQPSYQYVQPSTQYVVPDTSYTVTQPSRPLPPAPIFDGGPIVVSNPATNDQPMEYSINGTRFVIKPGQSQKFVHDREWIVEFDRGPGFGAALYSLKAAQYKFKPTAKGWELFESAGFTAPRGDAPAPPENDPQSTGPANLGAPQPASDISEASGSTKVPRIASEPVDQVVPKRKLPKPPEPSTSPAE